MNLPGFSDSLASVIDNPARCQACGATTRVAHGLCVSCHLRTGLDDVGEASSAIFESVLAEDDVPDRQWRLGNYEILEEIGRGGMGVIYRARQRHSRRIVALKRVLSYHADSHETLARFRREAEAVASLDHPNILPIYEVGESEDGLPFFSMKYATGGSLREAAPSLGKQPRECVRLLAKVTRATEYAHSQGILHRDLKPGNILLDARGEPLVCDFGLAKWLDANSDLTRTLTTFGTPGYIAPEQADGKTMALAPAADIYSLGAILFDLLAGRPPFLGAHALSVIRHAAEAPAPKLRTLARSLDRDLETICARCLERDPAMRYHSAGGLADDLECWLGRKPIKARPVSIPTRVWRWSRRNPILGSAAAACLVLAVAVTWLWVRGGAPIAPGKSIAVLPFENIGNEENNIIFTEEIQNDISRQLTKVADLKVIAGDSAQQYKAGAPRDLREIARTMGVRHVLEGSVRRANGRIEVSVQLIDASKGTHLWTEYYATDIPQSLAIQSEVAQAVADQLHAKVSPAETVALEQHLDASGKSEALYIQSREPDMDQLRRERLLNEATLLDSKYNAFAYCDLVEAEYQLLQLELERGGEKGVKQKRTALAKQALDNAVRLEPNTRETYRARIQYQYDILQDYVEARRELDLALRTFPNAVGLWLLAGRCDRRLGRWEDCVADLQRAYQIDPDFAVYLLARTYILDLRRYAEAEQALQQAVENTNNSARWPYTYAQLGECYLAKGDPRAASNALARIPSHSSPDEKESAARITTALYLRDYDSASRLLASAPEEIFDSEVMSDNAVCPRSWFGARIARAQHGAEKSRDAFAIARKEAELKWKASSGKAQQLSLLACMDAGAGRKEDAIREAKQAVELCPASKDAGDAPYLATNLALVYAWSGERDLAIEQLEALAMIPCGPSYGDLKLNPRWDDLRGDPRFEKMTASLAPKP